MDKFLPENDPQLSTQPKPKELSPNQLTKIEIAQKIQDIAKKIDTQEVSDLLAMNRYMRLAVRFEDISKIPLSLKDCAIQLYEMEEKNGLTSDSNSNQSPT